MMKLLLSNSAVHLKDETFGGLGLQVKIFANQIHRFLAVYCDLCIFANPEPRADRMQEWPSESLVCTF